MASSSHLLEMKVDLTLKRSQDQNRSNRRLGWPDPRHCVAAPPPLRVKLFFAAASGDLPSDPDRQPGRGRLSDAY